MRKINFCSLVLALFVSQNVDAQCIKSIQNLIEMPAPCFFVGNIDFDNPDCFDVFAFPQWKYTWNIRDADDGDLVAKYSGAAFQHSFVKFGGYEFCLEVDKDGDPNNTPDIVDCVTYTTCQICSEDEIKVDYIKCPTGAGCDITLSASIHATNAVGLKPTGKFIITYLPTPQEILGGNGSYDIEFDDVDIEYHPQTDSISITQNLTVPYRRGCFKPRIEFTLDDGYGASGTDGIPCTTVELFSEKKFRCIACANEEGKCIASVVASQISNEQGTCNIFTSCNQLREDEGEYEANSHHVSLDVSPNPANDQLHVDLPISDCEQRQVLVFNNIGQRVMQLDIPSNESHADLLVGSLRPGLYFVALREYGELSHSTQVVISR